MRNVMSLIKKFLVPSLIVSISILIALIMFEVGLRLITKDDGWEIPTELNFLRNFDYNYSIKGLYEAPVDVVEYSRNEFGLRDNCHEPSLIRILTIGGSTTDLKYVSLNDAYQTVLGNLISSYVGQEVCVSNAGIDGHSTYGNLATFKYWLPLIPNLNPEYVLLYIGVNDAQLLRHMRGDYGVSRIKLLLKKKLYLVQRLLPFYRYVRDSFFDNERDLYTNHKPAHYTANDYVVSKLHDNVEPLTVVNTAGFRDRLETILGNISNMGAKPICVTQPHRFIMEIRGQTLGIPNVMAADFSGLDFDYSIRSLNNVMRELCGDNLIDLYSAPFNEEHFYDGVHTTAKGSRYIGQMLYEGLLNGGKLTVFQQH